MAITFTQRDDTTNVCAAGAYCSGLSAFVGPSFVAANGATAGAGTESVLVGGSSTDTADMYITCLVDAGATWSNGTWTIRFEVTAANMNLTWSSVWVCRVNSGCTNQESLGHSSSLGISLSTTGVKSTTVSGSAATPSAGDNIVLVFGFTNAAMTTQSFDVKHSQNIDSPFSVSSFQWYPMDEIGLNNENIIRPLSEMVAY